MFKGYTAHYFIVCGLLSTAVYYQIRHGRKIITTGILHSSISMDDVLLIGSYLPVVSHVRGKLHNESQCRLIEVFGCASDAVRAAQKTWAKADERYRIKIGGIKQFNLNQLKLAFGV